mgnify:CR=1 FL=1
MNIVNTYCLPVPVFSTLPQTTRFMAVLTKGAVEDFAVYLGLVPLPDQDNPETYKELRDQAAQWVAHHGLKVNYKVAVAYFPFLTKEEYRA